MAKDDKQLHVALACGGTGGHIFPGLATAEQLDAMGHKVTLWLAGKDIEAKAVADTPWEKITVKSKGWEGGWKGLPAFALHFLRARRRSRSIMRKDRPDVLLAMGSYAGMGPAAAALSLDVPVVLHEANSVPGRMVSFFAGRATRVAGTFEMSRHALKDKARLEITGLPLRSELLRQLPERPRERSAEEPFHILCMGGSRGARALNRIVRRALRELIQVEPNIFVTHLTGTQDEEEVRLSYEKDGIPHQVSAFESDMAPLYARCDIAICRAGASTCAELSVFGVPALLVPYPYAARNHQMINAEEFFRKKAADVIPEADLEVQWLREYLEGCLHSPERLQRLQSAVQSWGRRDAAERLAHLVEEAAGEG